MALFEYLNLLLNFFELRLLQVSDDSLLMARCIVPRLEAPSMMHDQG